VPTNEELQGKIKALEDAGLDASAEKDLLAKQTAGVSAAVVKKSTPAPVPAPVAEEPEEPESEEEEEGDDLFIPLNLESFRTGGGGWITPDTTGWKDAVCINLVSPSHVVDQKWFIFENVPGADELFRGALVTAALSKGAGEGGAWKVKEVLDALGVEYTEDEESGGIRMNESPKGKSVQVFYDDIVIKGKPERRIQDARSNVEPAV